MTIKNIIKFYHKEIIFHYTGKYRGTGHHICNLRCKTIKEIPVIFHIWSTSDYNFIINELAKESDGKFECLGENTEKYTTFSVPFEENLIITKQLHTN